MDAKANAEAVRAVVTRAVSGTGVEVEDVVVHPAGKRRLLRISVVRDISGLPDTDDRSPVAPLSLDEVADATRAISAALDEADASGGSGVLTGAYTLEVSSAGVSTPLTTRAQLRRNVGRLVRLQRSAGAEGDAATPREPVTGRLLSVGADELRIDGVAEAVPLDQVVRAVVQVEFTRAEDATTNSSAEAAAEEDD